LVAYLATKFAPWQCIDTDIQKLNMETTVQHIQCGNFNWNKIHNLDIGGFCKKSQNRSIFVFPCPHFSAYGFCISPPGSAQPPLTFFVKWKGTQGVRQVTPCLKAHFARNATHYLFPEYFQSLRAKK
jgi:hypothetical protein